MIRKASECQAALEQALNSAVPGDEIVLKDETHSNWGKVKPRTKGMENDSDDYSEEKD